jgi:ATP-binding cassette subfamily B protein
LRRLCEGRTTFVVTHDLEAARDADRVVWIEDGAVRLDGDPETVLGVMNRAERV